MWNSIMHFRRVEYKRHFCFVYFITGIFVMKKNLQYVLIRGREQSYVNDNRKFEKKLIPQGYCHNQSKFFLSKFSGIRSWIQPKADGSLKSTYNAGSKPVKSIHKLTRIVVTRKETRTEELEQRQDRPRREGRKAGGKRASPSSGINWLCTK